MSCEVMGEVASLLADGMQAIARLHAYVHLPRFDRGTGSLGGY
jgi:hypothetical protein